MLGQQKSLKSPSIWEHLGRPSTPASIISIPSIRLIHEAFLTRLLDLNITSLPPAAYEFGYV